ncbi:unnamed protein product [Malus baccata var. baccata]
MSIVPRCELKPLRNDMRIKVRICWMWRPKMFNQFNGLQCVLVDELVRKPFCLNVIYYNELFIIFIMQNNAIEALVLEADYEIVAPKIKVGCIYEITWLHNRSNKQTYKVVPYIVHVKSYVVGRITAVQPLEDKMVNKERLETKCEVHLQNTK